MNQAARDRRARRVWRPALAAVAAIGVTLVPATTGSAHQAASASSARAQATPAPAGLRADFNGDGFADLAIGIPDEDVGGFADAGAVSVIYGSASGLSATGNQHWTQDSRNVPDQSEAGDHWGTALSAGDYNGDGFTDLAIGAGFEDVGSASDA